MNVFLVIYVYPPEHAPAGVNARELAIDLAKYGHNVTVLTGWPSHPQGVLYPGWKKKFRSAEHVDGYRLIRCGHAIHPRKNILWRLWVYFSFAISSLANGLASGRCDVVLCESTPIFGPVTSWLLAKIKGARHIYKIHDLYPESALNAKMLSDGFVYRTLRKLDTWVCRKSHVVATLSQSMRKNLLDRGLDESKVIIARHWLDGDFMCPRDRDNEWRRAHDIPVDKFVALHAGTIGYISGAQVIIHAAERLKDRDDILILFVGEGPLKAPCQQLVEQLGLTNVRFLPFQPQEVLPDVQSTGDAGLVTLLPDTGESSIPSKMHGYTSAGRPVIASVRSDTPTAKMVASEDMGIVTASQDADALAEAIRLLADDPDRRRRMGRNGREFFLREYDRKALTSHHEKILSGRDASRP